MGKPGWQADVVEFRFNVYPGMPLLFMILSRSVSEVAARSVLMEPLDGPDFTARMARAIDHATAAGLTGLLITPGPG